MSFIARFLSGLTTADAPLKTARADNDCDADGVSRKDKKEALSRAALDKLFPLPDVTKYWHPSQAGVDHANAWVTKMRTWIGTIEDPDVREAYDGWVRYVERNALEAQQEVNTRAHAKEQREYSDRRDAEDAKTREIIRSMPPLPEPPR